MGTDTAPALAALFKPIQADLQAVEAQIGRMMQTESGPLKELITHVSRFSGKRLRPAFTIVAGRICGEVLPETHKVGAILELIHTATLVHDDILDESSMRRRVSTINRRDGNETAVLLGDYIFATCFKEAADLQDRFVSRYLAEIVGVVCAGEIRQVHHRNDLELTEETYFRIIEEKTAALYAAALRCGARIAGAPETQKKALETFGLKMGCAFQIVDDILDLTGTEATVGKSLGTDLEKAKMTLPLLRLRERASGNDLERMREAVLSNDPDKRRSILLLLDEYGAVESARETAERLVAEAKAELKKVPDAPERAFLLAAADYVLDRDR